MKKFLSIVLTLTLLVSCVAVIPSLATSAADTTANSVLSDDINSDVYTTLLDTNGANNANWISPLEPDTESGRQNGYSYDETMGAIKLNDEFASADILATNNANSSGVADFVWQFDYAPAENAEHTRAKFLFHTTENSIKINTNSSTGNVFNTANNAYAVYIAGSSRTTSSGDYLYPGGLFVEAYNGSAMRPVDGYYTDNGADSNAPNYSPKKYIPLDLDNNKFYTIRISMTGKEITVDAWVTGDISTKKTITLVNTWATLTNNTPASGDFSICLGDVRSSCYIKNMTISRPSLIFDSSKNTIAQNPGNAAQTYSSKTVGDITVANNVYKLPKYAATDEILENALGEEVNLTDFVWETEFAVDNSESNADFAGISFNFHVDKSRTDTASVIPGDSGTGTSTTSRKYMQSATVYGKDIVETHDAADASALVLQSSVTGGTGYVYGASTVNLNKTSTTGTYRYSRSAVQTSNNLAKNTWYTVRIVLSGNNMYAYIWETANKVGTLRSVYHKLTNEQLASAQSGDFAIVNNYRIVNIKNMRIWDNLDVIRSAEDYSAYTNILPATTYDFENGLNDTNYGLGELYKAAPSAADKIITFETVDDGNGGKRLQAGSATDTERTRIDNLDGYSKNLADFIFTTEFSTVRKTSDWSNDQIVFRGAGSDYYALELRRRSRNNTDAEYKLNHDYIALVKKFNNETITLAEASLSRSYSYEANYKIKIAAIGNTITVWFAEDDLFVQPAITYTDNDNPITAGFMYIFHDTATIAYYDNINIYDITATELASSIDAATGDNVKRGDDSAIDGLVSKYNAMDPSQRIKLSARKTALDTATEKLAELEKAGHNVNGEGDIDIRDIVRMRNCLADPLNTTISENADPLFDTVLDYKDIAKIRYWVLDLVWSDSAVE